MICIFCGCSENDPCCLWDPETLELNPCAWLAPHICTNPKCKEKAIAEGMTEADFELYDDEDLDQDLLTA